MVIGKINDKNYIVRYMKRIFLTSILSALLLTGCNNEESFDSVSSTVELKATIENSESRVAFNQQGKFLWTINDAIGVTTTQNKTSFSKMTINEGGAGQSTATFTGKYMSGTPEGYAVYPHNANHKLDGTTLTYHFPESYDYTIEDHDYFVSDGTGNSFNPPMWSEISSGKVNFKHLGGVLCIKIADLPAGEDQQLKLIASNKITGDFSTDLANSPVLETSTSTEDNTVTINYSNAKESTRVFYVPVPTGTYSKLTIQFEAEGETIEVPFENKVIKLRSLQILQVGEGSIEGGEDNSKVVMNLDELNAALGNENVNTIVLGDNLTLPSILEIKRNITFDGNGKKLTSSAGRAINVSGVSKATIKNLTIEASGERAINIIQNTKEVIIDNVTATAANYTINVASSAPAAKVTISNSNLTGLNVVNVASQNTEVIVSNSTINCNDNNTTKGEAYAALCLHKDAVGGKITATDCTINVTEGSDSTMGRNAAEDGTVTINDSTEDVEIDVAAIIYGDYYYGFTSLAKAFEFAENGNKITLIRNFTLEEQTTVPADKNITLDLNGHTITGTDNATDHFGLITLNPGSNLSIISSNSEGKITLKATNNREFNKYSSVISNQCATLTVGNNVVIEHLGGTDMAYGIDNLTNTGAQHAKTTVDGATVKSTYRAIRQFLNSTAQGVNNELHVKNGIIEGANKSIWMQNANNKANPGKLTVEATAQLKGDVQLSASNAAEWPVEVSIASIALVNGSKVLTSNVTEDYEVIMDNGCYVVKKVN